MIDSKLRVELWCAINDYAVACEGTPSVIGSRLTKREEAVAEVEKVVEEMLEPLRPRDPRIEAPPKGERVIALLATDPLHDSLLTVTRSHPTHLWLRWWPAPTPPGTAEE